MTDASDTKSGARISATAGSGVSRRALLKGSAAALGTAALFDAARLIFPGGVPSAYASEAPETTKAVLGFIALTDAAPLFVAKEKGIFDKYGMTDVTVAKQASWGTTRGQHRAGLGGQRASTARIFSRPCPT